MHRVGIIIGLLVLAVILMAVGTYMDIKQEARMPSMTGFSKEAFWMGALFSASLSTYLLLYGHVKSCENK